MMSDRHPRTLGNAFDGQRLEQARVHARQSATPPGRTWPRAGEDFADASASTV
jgi:hypothetical protein